MDELAGPILLTVLALAVYFLPSIIGWNKRNADAIVALNLFLGWTFVGWVAAFVWALTVEPEDEVIHDDDIDQRVDNIERIERLKRLLDSGAITEDEYEEEKAKLLGKPKVIKPGNTVEF